MVQKSDDAMPLKPASVRQGALPTRALGRSGLDVTVIGFGAAPLGDLYFHLDDALAIAAVEAAYQAGIRLFDTSPHYGNGLSEHRCGTALRRIARESFVLSSKVGRYMQARSAREARTAKGVASPGFAGGFPHRSIVDYSFDGTLRSFEQSMLRLGVDRLDIALIHDVDVWTHGAEQIETRFREAMAGAYRALERLRSEGAVKVIGVGVNEADMCARFARAGDFDAMLLAGRYSLLEQPALAEFLPLAQEKGIGVMLGGVFNSGILATGPVPGAHYNYKPAAPEVIERVGKIARICGAHGVDLPDAALRFPLGHPAVACVVLGAVTPGEVARNVASLTKPIPAALWSDLKAQGLLAAQIPTPAETE
jgi:D-threo-aldose 1-dehydrogenase